MSEVKNEIGEIRELLIVAYWWSDVRKWKCDGGEKAKESENLNDRYTLNNGR